MPSNFTSYLFNNQLAMSSDGKHYYYFDNVGNFFADGVQISLSNKLPIGSVTCDKSGKKVYIKNNSRYVNDNPKPKYTLISNDYGINFELYNSDNEEFQHNLLVFNDTLFYTSGGEYNFIYYLDLDNHNIAIQILPNHNFEYTICNFSGFIHAGNTFYTMSDFTYENNYFYMPDTITKPHTLLAYNIITNVMSAVTSFPTIPLYYLSPSMAIDTAGTHMYVCMVLPPLAPDDNTQSYGIWVSNDGQKTWKQTLKSNPNFSQITCSDNGKYVYAAINDDPGGIYWSFDYGVTWFFLNGLSLNNKSYYRTWLSLLTTSDGSRLTGVWRDPLTGFFHIEHDMIVFNNIYTNICFPRGTLIKTDHGHIPIQKLNTQNTFRGERMKALVISYNTEGYLVEIKKNALEQGMPSKTLHLSCEHKILYQGQWIAAKHLVGHFGNNVLKVKYSDDLLYNILLKKHSYVEAHGLIVETLHPNNPIARQFIMENDS
jgi:hypothetical protein